MLYFDNLSRDSNDVYLADGLTDEITSRLGQVARLVVTSRTTMQRYRRVSRADPTTLAQTLRVAHLVNGSVRRGVNRVRVSVELVRAKDGVQLRSDTYDRTSGDVLDIEEDVARSVATAIAGRLLPQERATLAARPTRSAVAYDHFLRGNYALSQRSEASLARAIAEYQAALRFDSTFTAALSRIAYTYTFYVAFGWTLPGLPAESLLARGMATADRAVQLDSASSDAWMARGFLLTFRNPMTLRGAREAFERAIALDPDNAEALHQYGNTLQKLGNDSAAEAAYARALAIDPLRPVTLRFMAQLRLLQRKYPEALRWADSAIAVDSTFALAYVDRARASRLLGDTAGARLDADALQRFATAGTRRWAEATRVLAEMAAGDTLAAREHANRLFQQLVAGDSTGADL